jgi:hypothetical protein
MPIATHSGAVDTRQRASICCSGRLKSQQEPDAKQGDRTLEFESWPKFWGGVKGDFVAFRVNRVYPLRYTYQSKDKSCRTDHLGLVHYSGGSFQRHRRSSPYYL